MPAKGRSQVWQELAQRMAVHEEFDQGFEQASDEHKDPVNERLEQDRLTSNGARS